MRNNDMFNVTHSSRKYIVLFIWILGLWSCKSEEQNTTSSSVPFDPMQPVVVEDFQPKSGGMGQRLIIYGKNFGTDPSMITVLIGGKEAKVISSTGDALYCLVPRKAFSGDIEVRVGPKDNKVVGKATTRFQYERKMVVSTVIGYRNERGDEPWKDGKFKDSDPNKMASGFWNQSFFKFDPANPKHLWAVFDFNNGLYLFNFEDSTVTKVRSDLDRPRSVDFHPRSQVYDCGRRPWWRK
ncbi:IPT/TIG domain-containing protein [Sphingobacterium sp. T2]|uniref:IPT/TIG domain-containing protein n=1 Tax=Sphingobacterium sp. T2 TaxID=1590596 RepID=UPI0018CF173E|nr:IPT/TIG domain-containing protein [Sphingobacterium sp. T2]